MSFKILQISQKSVFPPLDGGKVAMNSLVEGLAAAGCLVHRFMLDTPAHPLSQSQIKESEFVCFTAQLDTRIRTFTALKNLLFESESYQLSRFRNDAIAKQIHQLIEREQYTCVIAESIFSLKLIEPVLDTISCPVILRTHNVEHRIWEGVASQSSNMLKRFYLGIMNRRMRNDELQLWAKSNGILAISRNDENVIRKSGIAVPMRSVAVATKFLNASTTPEPPKLHNLFHLGAMDWRPNSEGIRKFITHFWPPISSTFPELKLHLAGKSMPSEFSTNYNKQIYVDGEVENAHDYMHSNGIMLVPLWSGSGIRIKIIEGLSLGKIIITTPIGASGIDVQHGRELFICDTVEEFIEAIRVVQSEPRKAAEISKNAITFAQQNYKPETLAKDVMEFIASVKKQ
jgi:hypothetical protein